MRVAWKRNLLFREIFVRYLATEVPTIDQRDLTNLSVLAERDVTALDEVSRHFPVGFNLAAFVNHSETLKEFINLGVDLHKIEKKPDRAKALLQLDFTKGVKPHLTFLHDVGVEATELGRFITKNPMIFGEDLEDLQVRINYLQCKNFTAPEISRIVQKNPFWLMFPTQRIDKRLGFFQQSFELTGTQTRSVAVSQPRLITYSMEFVRKSTFSVKEEMGFDKWETKQLLLAAPKLWMIDHNALVEKFSFIHQEMGITHKQLLKDPNILFSREFRIKQRHKFLQFLSKAQYDPKKDLYISLQRLVSGTDEEFILNVANSNLQTYDTFLKTL